MLLFSSARSRVETTSWPSESTRGCQEKNTYVMYGCLYTTLLVLNHLWNTILAHVVRMWQPGELVKVVLINHTVKNINVQISKSQRPRVSLNAILRKTGEKWQRWKIAKCKEVIWKSIHCAEVGSFSILNRKPNCRFYQQFTWQGLKTPSLRINW